MYTNSLKISFSCHLKLLSPTTTTDKHKILLSNNKITETV